MADIIKTVGDGHGTPDYATLTLWNAGEGGADPGAGFTSIANCSGFCGASANINGTFIRGYEILGVDAAYDGTNDALLASTKSLTLTTANGLVEDLYITNVNLFAVALAFNAANTSVRRVFIDSAVNTSGGGGNCVSFSGALVAGRLLERFVIDGTNDNECIMGGFNREYTLNKGVLYNSKGTNATGSSSTQQVTDVYSADAVTADYGAGLELTSSASSDATGSAGLQNITLSSAIVNAGAKDFRSKSGGPLDGTGSVDFVGAFLEVGGGVTVTATLGAIDYTSQNASVALTGSIDLITTLGTISYSNQNATVSLSGAVDVAATLGLINYSSQNATVTVTGDIDVISTLGAINYSSNNATVNLTSETIINATLGAIDYSSQGATVILSGLVDVTATLGSIVYNSYPVTVQIGEGQTIGNVTAGFADDIYTAGFKPDTITVSFK